ncbi:glycoside hydrolase family 71 protein [Infundibulicybe gibba]|nr:glycoside hydrolase family 71 protein [Infundibulicybe gibba]
MMPSTTFIVQVLALFTAAHALVIPFKQSKVSLSTRDEPDVSRTHPRFFIRQNTPQSTITATVSSTIQSLIGSSTPSPTASTSAASTLASASATPSPPPSSDGPRKFVVAHHMVGNTFPYVLQDWADDIALAHASGIDGFALNTGRDAHEPDRIADAYEAARQSGLDFKLFLSLDMASRPCASPADAQTLRALVSKYIDHPNQFRYNDRAFVSTFAGETCQFGQGSVPEGWKSQFARNPELDGKIYFVPSFFIDPAKFVDFADVMDGDFNVTTSFAQNLLSNPAAILNNVVKTGSTTKSLSTANVLADAATAGLSTIQNALSKFIGSTDTDKKHLEGLAVLEPSIGARGEESKRAYMAAVSPWFFTHYSPETFNKNFIFLADQHLYSKRWESLIASRDQFDIVQVLTWNDYGESHYVGPIKGSQPNSEAWVDGMNHTSWLEMTQYYSTAFKTGSFPKIEKDKIFMWSRPHPCKASAPDPVGQPSNFELSQDNIWAVVMTTAPSTVTLSTSASSTQTFSVPAGLTKLSMPISAGGFMKGTIQRDGKTVVELNPTTFTFQGSPKSYNFNAFVASATAE